MIYNGINQYIRLCVHDCVHIIYGEIVKRIILNTNLDVIFLVISSFCQYVLLVLE